MAADPATQVFLIGFIVVMVIGWFIMMWIVFKFWTWVLRFGTRTVRDEWDRK